MDIRMIAFDIDGTLRAGHGFPERNVRALQACERRGIRLVLNSGRPIAKLHEFARELGIDPWMVSCNGARIDRGLDGIATAEEHPIEPRKAWRIYDAMMQQKLLFIIRNKGGAFHCFGGDPADLPENFSDALKPRVASFDGLSENVCVDLERASTEGMIGAYKFIAEGTANDPRFDILREELSDLNLTIVSSGSRNFEVMETGVDKGSALRRIAEIEGIPAESIMAFGDFYNDEAMFNAAGWSVCMENGAEDLKRRARLVAPPNTEAGVAQILEKYVLEKKA